MAAIAQLALQARTPVSLVALAMRDAQHIAQSTIGARARTLWTLLPRIEATPRHAERVTHHVDRERCLLRRDPGEGYSSYLAKKAVAFFRMSRSICNRRFSRRSRCSSARSSSVSGSCGSARAALTHACKLFSVTPRSFAILLSESLDWRTIRMASALNSVVYRT